jgi:hypothetical protein
VLGKASRWGYSWNKERYDKAIKKLMPKKNERKRSFQIVILIQRIPS